MDRGHLRRRPPKRYLANRLAPIGAIGRRWRGGATVLVSAAVLVAGGCGAAQRPPHNTATRSGPPTTATAAVVTIGPPAQAPTPPRRLDLGTLGGAFSSPTAMSGTIVVGVSGTPGDSSSYLGHAFAYDLAAAHPHMVDLGTLGGRFSGANAVDGTWVVGGADSTDGTSHAFAYNLAATRPHMIDLGTAIPDCYADAITGNWVVGTCFPPEHQTESRAFAYNLSGGHSHMIDLGTLGGTTAAAFATDGTWAVGYSTTKDGAAHVYAYNLETARPRMTDLGTVGPSPWSRADYVQGGRVLGESPPATFVYDLDTPNATIKAIGSLGGAGAAPAAVDEEWVVGSSATADGSQHAFAYNFAAPHPRMIDLGTLGGPQSTQPRCPMAGLSAPRRQPMIRTTCSLAISTAPTRIWSTLATAWAIRRPLEARDLWQSGTGGSLVGRVSREAAWSATPGRFGSPDPERCLRSSACMWSCAWRTSTGQGVLRVDSRLSPCSVIFGKGALTAASTSPVTAARRRGG